MIRYIIKRFLLGIISLFILMSIIYLLVASFSKNPFLVGGNNLDDAEQLAKTNGLLDPILVRYGRYFSGFFTGNFGVIYNPPYEVANIPEFFFSPLKWTLLITAPAFIISIIFGVLLGVLAGYNRGKWVDSVINLFVMIFIGLPSFVFAPIMIMIAIKSNGVIIPSFIRPDTQNWLVTIKSLLLPITTVTLSSLAGYTILTRNQVVSVLSSNHVLIAKSKGLSQWEIFWKHIARNITIPIIAYMVPAFIILLAGNVVIESFFMVPGVSEVIIQAFPNGEINITMFSIFFFAGVSMLSQLILDVSFVMIDPKIKFFEASKTSLFVILKNKIIRKKTSLEKNKNNIEIEEGGAHV